MIIQFDNTTRRVTGYITFFDGEYPETSPHIVVDDFHFEHDLDEYEVNAEGKILHVGKTPEQLAEIVAQKAQKAKREAKRTGLEYNGYLIPFTSQDALGVFQVKSAFDLGLKATTLEFSNGTHMPITASEFPAFARWFVSGRNRFFHDDPANHEGDNLWGKLTGIFTPNPSTPQEQL